MLDDYLEEVCGRGLRGGQGTDQCDVPCVFPSQIRPDRPEDRRRVGGTPRRSAGASVLSWTWCTFPGPFESSSDLYGSACVVLAGDRSGSSFTDAVSGRLDYCLLDALEHVLVAAVRSPQGYVPFAATVAACCSSRRTTRRTRSGCWRRFARRGAVGVAAEAVPFLAECATLDRAVAAGCALDARLRPNGEAQPPLRGLAHQVWRLRAPGGALRCWTHRAEGRLPQAVLAFLETHGDQINSR